MERNIRYVEHMAHTELSDKKTTVSKSRRVMFYMYNFYKQKETNIIVFQ